MHLSEHRKLLGIALFFFVLLGVFAITGYYLLKGYRKTERFEIAVRTFREGNYPLAKRLLLRVVAEDPNKEAAYAALAEISRSEGDWQLEAEFLERAVRLNPLSAEYQSARLTAMLKGRDYAHLYTMFAVNPPSPEKASDDLAFAYLLSLYLRGQTVNANRFWSLRLGVFPGSIQTDRGRLFAEYKKKTTPGGAPDEKVLRELLHSEDELVAFESGILLLTRLSGKDAAKKEEEKTLRRITELNPFSGRAMLALYLISQSRFSEAAEEYEKQYKQFGRAVFIVPMAELFVYTGQKEKLKNLSAEFHPSTKIGIRIAHYLDALNAFMAQEPEKTFQSLQKTGRSFTSKLSYLVSLYADIGRANTSGALKYADYFRRSPPFLDFRDRAFQMVAGYVRVLLSEGKIAEASGLAEIIHNAEKPDLLLTRVILAGKVAKHLLTFSELRRALAAFPEDPVILQLASEYFYQEREYAKALEWAEKCIATNPPSDSGAYLVRIQSLTKLGRGKEISGEFARILKAHPDDIPLMTKFYDYCAGNEDAEGFRFLEGIAASAKPDSERAQFLPFIRAELLLLDGKKEEALNLLETVDSDNSTLLFRASYLLGLNDRYAKAIRNYNKLLSMKNVSQALLLINLAELENASGNRIEAMHLAEKAWKLVPKDANVVRCYADKLVINGNYEKALDIINLKPADRDEVSEALLRIWKQSAEALIQKFFDENRDAKAEELCRMLALYDNNSAIAKEYQAKLRERRRNAFKP